MGRNVISHATLDEMLAVEPVPTYQYGGDSAVFSEWKTHDEVKDAARTGRAWPATMAKYRTMDAIDPGDVPKLRQARRHRVWDDLSGDTADVGRALVAIAPWEQYRRTAAKRSVTVGICATMGVTNSAENYNANALTAVRIVDALIGAGYDVKVLMVYGGELGDKGIDWLMITVPVKEFGAPFDQEQILALSQTAFSRLYGAGYRRHTSGSEEPVACKKFPTEMLVEAGIDILIARQWHDDTQQDYTRKVFEEVTALMDGAEVANAPA